MAPPHKLNILFLAASPNDTDQLTLDEEVRAVDQSIRVTNFGERFQLYSHWMMRYTDMPQVLLRYSPHIVHFSGLGSAEGRIAFNDRAGNKRPVPPSLLKDLFALLHDNIRCVVLSACYFEEQANAIAESIECVAGTTRAVSDEDALQFSVGFYLGLGHGRSIKTAVGLGRIMMESSEVDENKLPKLFALKVEPSNVALPTTSSMNGNGSVTDSDKGIVVPYVRELKGRKLENAVEAIASAYSSETKLAQMVSVRMNEKLTSIADGDGLTEKIYSLLEWARMRGRLTELLQSAVDGNPTNQDLRDYLETLM